MRLTEFFRAIVVAKLLLLLLQAVFAGRLIDGDYRSLHLHGVTAMVLVLMGALQALVSIVLWRKGIAPRAFVFANAGFLVGLVLTFGAGERHILVLHIPLALLLMGGLVRQMFWIRNLAERPAQLEAAR